MKRRAKPNQKDRYHQVTIRMDAEVYLAYLAESARRSVQTGVRVGFSQVMHDVLKRYAPKGS